MDAKPTAAIGCPCHKATNSAASTCLPTFQLGTALQVILQHPPVLCYSVERLQQLSEYLSSEVGLSKEQLCELIMQRPSLLGLPHDNVSRIVGFLQESGVPHEEIVKLLGTTL